MIRRAVGRKARMRHESRALLAMACAVAAVVGMLGAAAPPAHGSAVVVVNPTYAMTARITLPSLQATSPVYGGWNGDLYVTAFSGPTANGTLTVISGATNQIVAKVMTGWEPGVPVVDPANGNVYVANYDEGCGEGVPCWHAPPNVTVVSEATNAPVADIQTPANPWTAGVDPVDGNIFVVDNAGLSIISGSNNTVLATVSAGPGPSSLAYDTANGDLYVTDGSGVQVLSASNGSEVASISISSGGGSAAMFDPWNGDVYVATTYGAAIISGSTNTILRTLPYYGLPVFIDVQGDVVFFNAGSPGNITLVSSATGQRLSSFTAGTASYITYDPANGLVFSTAFDSRIMNITFESTGALVGSVSDTGGGFLQGLPTVDPANGNVYVTDDLGYVAVFSEVAPSAGASTTTNSWWYFGGGVALGAAAAAVVAVLIVRRKKRPEPPPPEPSEELVPQYRRFHRTR